MYKRQTQLNGRYLEMIHVWFQPSWIVRTRAAIPGLSESMQQALAAADPRLPFASFRQLDELQSLALSQQHLEVRLLTILAALALLMSVVGIYGLVSNLVVQRTREIGIRMALGCTPRKATVQVAGSGLLAVAVGVVIGLVLAALALPVLKNEIYGVRNLDPLTLAAVSFILLLAALLASFVPARRITRIDPAATLRSE